MAKDPVCGMVVDKATAIRAAYDDTTYYFCSQARHDAFVADSGRFISKAGEAAR